MTFVIPFFENLDYLSQAIESVRAQINVRWKSIILDDCGEYGAKNLVGSIRDPRFLYVRNERNLGLAENWNQGLALAETEFVTILHADDLLLPNYLDEVLQLMDRHIEATAGHCESVTIDEKGEKCWTFVDVGKKILRPKTSGDLVTVGEAGVISLLGGSWITCPTLCYRKNKIGGFAFNAKWRFVVDVELYCRVLMAGGSIVGSKAIAYQYRRHNKSQTSRLTQNANRFVEQFEFLDEISRNAPKIGWDECALRSRRKSILRVHLLFQAVFYLISRERHLSKCALKSALTGIDRFAKQI